MHEPQCPALFIVSMQPTPAQSVRVVSVHAQLLATQAVPLPHTLPHVPQFAASLTVFTQTPEQTLGAVGGHVHVPPMQTCPPLHALLQRPQFVWLVIVSTHAVRHSVRPAVVQVHAPAWHDSSARHAWPHVPQLRGSSIGTGTPPHVRQSSVAPLQSLSRPSPQISVAESATQPHTFAPRPSGATQPQLLPTGQSVRTVHVRVQTPAVADTRTHRPDTQSSSTWHGAANAASGPSCRNASVDASEPVVSPPPHAPRNATSNAMRTDDGKDMEPRC